MPLDALWWQRSGEGDDASYCHEQRTANMLLLGEALSPRIGDLIAVALTHRPIARLLGMSRGRTYHETIASAQHV